MVFQSQKLSFDAGSLDDLEGLGNPSPDKPDSAQPKQSDEPSNGRLHFDSDLEEIIEEFLAEKPVMERGTITVEFKRVDKFGLDDEKEQRRSFREFLFQELPQSNLPLNFDAYVSQNIGAITFALEDAKNEGRLYDAEGFPYGVLLNCDREACDVTGPSEKIADGLHVSGGNFVGELFKENTLLLVGIPEDLNAKEILDTNHRNFYNYILNTAKSTDTPVLFFSAHDREIAGRHKFSENQPYAILHPDGNISPF